jgi:hypothetical protein
MVDDDVTFVYMTLIDYELHLKTVMTQHVNTHRFQMLRAIFNNTPRPFFDEIWPNIAVLPLANGDGTTFPPLIGTTADTTAKFYLATNYAAGSISESNNPITVGVNLLQQRYGTPTGGSDIITFYNPAQDAAFKGLTEFVPIQYHWTPTQASTRRFPSSQTSTSAFPRAPGKSPATATAA